MERLTAADAEVLARRAAAGLQRRGLASGDRVAIVAPAPAAHHDDGARLAAARQQRLVLSLAYGALRRGIIPVMVNPALTASERQIVLDDADAQWVVADEESLASVFGDAQVDDAQVDIAPVPLGRAMHYTSGTTGRAKGVWGGIADETTARLIWADEIDTWSMGPGDLLLTHGPLAHSAPLRFAIATLIAGGDVLLPGWFDAKAFARSLAIDQPTIAFAVPSHLQRLMALPGELPRSPYRLLVHAGAACPPTLKRSIHSWVGVERTVEFYGATEGQFSICPGAEWEQRPGTVGRARAGRTLRTDEGVIWCAPPGWSAFEYWRDADKTARAWRSGPHGREFSVGDLGRLDSDGYLYLEGRRDDLIITGGVNVYPDEVEGVLLACPGVDQVAVFGLDDDQWGQRVCAAVVGLARHGDLRAWAQERLAGYKRPKDYFFLDDLPRTESGKIRRLALPEIVGAAADEGEQSR